MFYELARLYPDADLYTLVFEPSLVGEMGPYFAERGIKTSFVQRIPFARRHFQSFAPLYPFAARSLDLRAYDLVVSSSSAWVHAARVREDAVHVCYCHAPFRYAWSHFPEGEGHYLHLKLARPYLRWIRRQDYAAAQRVDRYIANSENTRRRIREYYGKDSLVVHPPVDVENYSISGEVDDYYLVVASLVRYKRTELAIEAANRLGVRLVVVGSGPEDRRLRALAGQTVEFRGFVADHELRRLYSRCRALIFPQEEDFGLVPLEAMASGRPVIAYAAGGALETMEEGKTGLLFREQSVHALARAITDFGGSRFGPTEIRAHAARFGLAPFGAAVRAAVDTALRVG